MFGIKIIESINCCENKQFRFPRSKKKRIINKWKKDSKNYKIIPKAIHDKINNVIYCHPTITAQLKKEFKTI